MGDSYGDWLREREVRARGTGGVRTRAVAQPTIEGNVWVPALQTVLVGLATGGGSWVLMLLARVAWGAAWRWGVGIGTVAAIIAAVAFVWQDRLLMAKPLRLEKEKLDLLRGPAPKREKRPAIIVRPPPRPVLPAQAGKYEMAIDSIDPEVDEDIRELYEFIVKVWGDRNVSRGHCRQEHGITRSTWERMVGGKRGGSGESARGLLDRAGVVYQDTAGWQIRGDVSLEEALGINEELKAYAERRAEMVRL